MGVTGYWTAKHTSGKTDSLRITRKPGGSGKQSYRIQYQRGGGYDGDRYDAKCAKSNFLAFTNGWKVRGG